MSAKSCETCEFFDPILRGTKPTNLAWCAKLSIYPYADSPGQVTPPNVRRVERPEMQAVPRIVSPKDGGNCPHFVARRAKVSKAELLAKAMGGKKA